MSERFKFAQNRLSVGKKLIGLFPCIVVRALVWNCWLSRPRSLSLAVVCPVMPSVFCGHGTAASCKGKKTLSERQLFFHYMGEPFCFPREMRNGKIASSVSPLD